MTPADERAEVAEEPSAAYSPEVDLVADGRVTRARRARERSRRQAIVAGSVALAVVLAAAIGWWVVSGHATTGLPHGASAAEPASSPVASGSVSTPAPAAAVSATPPVPVKPVYPTPIFASYKSMLIRLPVPLKALTEVGFHQASYGYALPMKTPLPDANLSKAFKNQGTGRKLSQQLSGPDAVLVGSVIRMWRARPGKPDTAADVGAKAGTVILAPVSGTIIKFKRYKLYGRWTDYEIHIQPTGHPKLDVVMIHVTDITSHVGEKVQAGLTPLAHIRKLSDKFHDQLADYSKGPGDHVHIEVNDTTNPTYRGLVGAIDPKTWHAGGAAGSSAGTDSDDSGRSGDSGD